MSRRDGAVVEALVRHVDREVEGRLVRDAGGIDDPVEVGRGARDKARGQVSGHDLRGALVEQLRLRVGLDRHYAWIRGQPRHLGGGESAVVGPEGVDRDGRAAGRRPGLGHLVARLLARRAGHRRDREQPRAARPVLELVGRGQDTDRPDGGMAALERGQAVHRTPARVDHIGVLGLVGQDAGAAPAQTLEPGLLRRAHELDERESLLAVGAFLGGERGAVGGRVDLARGRLDGPHVVAALGSGAAQALLVASLGLDQREGLVAGDDPRVGAGQGGRALGVRRNQQEVASPIGSLRLRRREDGEDQPGQKANSDNKGDDARDDYSRPFHRGCARSEGRGVCAGEQCEATHRIRHLSIASANRRGA